MHVCCHVKVRKQHTGEVFVPGGNCTEKRGLLIAQALLEQQSLFYKLAFCENALAHDICQLAGETGYYERKLAYFARK